MQPVQANERIDLIDIVRGLALFGILAANIRGFAGPAVAYFQPSIMWPGFADRLAQAFVDTFIQGKFITIFAVLFGVGFAVQLSRAEARGAKFGAYYVRRLLLLAAFGLVHGLFIWFGDILLVYAITGLLLLAFRKRTDKTIVTWAVISYFVPLLLMALATLVAVSGVEMKGPPKPDLAKLVSIYADGSWSEIQKQRGIDVVTMNWGFFPMYFMNVLGLFLFGVLAYRRRFFQPTSELLPAYRKAMIIGLTVGVIGNAAATTLKWIADVPMFPPSPTMLLVTTIQQVSILPLSLGYVCAVILLCADPAWKARLQRFAAIGRTALSNYLLQSVIGTLIFYNYGLGLFGQWGPAILLVPTVGIYALQAIISPWWLARYRFGPVEWLWRTLTYGRPQPMLRERGTAAVPDSASA